MIDLVLASPGSLVAGRRPGPEVRPVAGQVLVQVERVSLCGTDFRLFDGTYGGPSRYPIRFGHEWSGQVAEAPVGSSLRAGDRVTGDCSRWCGDCDLCSVDRNLCRRIEKFGISCDGFSTRHRLVEEKYLYLDEHGLGSDLLALTELFAVAARGVQRVLPFLREPVLVVGAGALGLATAMILRRRHGVEDVDFLEIDPARAAAVRERFAGVRFVDPPPADAAAAELSYAGISGLARYGLVCECSGSSGGLNTGILLAALRGHLLCFGLGRPACVRTDLVVSKALTLHGSIGGTGAFGEALGFLADHGAEAARMISHRFAADRARDAFLETCGDPSRIKVQLCFEERDA